MEKNKPLPLKSGMIQRVFILSTLSGEFLVLEFLARAGRKRKQKDTNRKGRSPIILICK
jgi:hypothetical protein